MFLSMFGILFLYTLLLQVENISEYNKKKLPIINSSKCQKLTCRHKPKTDILLHNMLTFHGNYGFKD